MVEPQRKKNRENLKKTLRRSHLRNRYYVGAKLSEYKLCLILRGFADDVPINQLATKIRISSKTIRSLYRKLRGQLIPASFTYPYRFGGAGLALYSDRGLSDVGKQILGAIIDRGLFRAHIQKHDRRVYNLNERQALLIEVTLRLFCSLNTPKTPKLLYPPEVFELSHEFQDIVTTIIDANFKSKPYVSTLKQLSQITERLETYLFWERVHALKVKSTRHHYPSMVLYEDLRRYLLKSPLKPGNDNVCIH